MKFSGAEIAARRSATRKYEALYNYGDLEAYVAQRCPAQNWNVAYYAATAVPNDRFLVIGGITDHPNDIEMCYIDRSEEEIAPLDLTALDPQYATNAIQYWQCSGVASGVELVKTGTLELNLLGHSAVYYPEKNKIIIYGGCQIASHSLFSDVHVVSVRTMKMKKLRPGKSLQPPGRLRHSACLVGSKMYIFGGLSHSSSNVLLEDLWSLDLITNRWERCEYRVYSRPGVDRSAISQQGPGKRFGHHMVHYKSKIFIGFGSDGVKALSDVWAYDLELNFWHLVELVNDKGDVHENLRGRADCASAMSGDIWMFHGGVDESGEMLNTLLEINLSTYECRRMRAEVLADECGSMDMSIASSQRRSILPALRGHSMCWHPSQSNTLVVFGGVNRRNEFNRFVHLLTRTGRCPLRLRANPYSDVQYVPVTDSIFLDVVGEEEAATVADTDEISDDDECCESACLRLREENVRLREENETLRAEVAALTATLADQRAAIREAVNTLSSFADKQ